MRKIHSGVLHLLIPVRLAFTRFPQSILLPSSYWAQEGESAGSGSRRISHEDFIENLRQSNAGTESLPHHNV